MGSEVFGISFRMSQLKSKRKVSLPKEYGRKKVLQPRT